MIINAMSPYKIIIERTSFNALEATFSTMYLTMKYPLSEGRVGMVRGDQGLTRKCYKDSLKLKRKSMIVEEVDSHKVNMVDIDPRGDPREDSLAPQEETEEVQIAPQSSKITHLGTNLSPKKEVEIVDILKRNIDLFAWKPSDMLDIDPNVMCHHLALDPGVKLVSQ